MNTSEEHSVHFESLLIEHEKIRARKTKVQMSDRFSFDIVSKYYITERSDESIARGVSQKSLDRYKVGIQHCRIL